MTENPLHETASPSAPADDDGEFYSVRVCMLHAHPKGWARTVFEGDYRTPEEAANVAATIRDAITGRLTRRNRTFTVTCRHSLADLAAAGRRDTLEAVVYWQYRAGRPRAPMAAESGLSSAEIGHALGRHSRVDHGLISAADLAEHYNLTEPSARRLMSDHGVKTVSGYPKWLALTVPRPGPGARVDLAGRRDTSPDD
jgi:hypothetical protein